MAEISNSCCDGNDRHGHLANIAHLLDLNSNRVPGPGRPPVPGSQKAYVISLPEATYVSQNGLFALLISTTNSIANGVKGLHNFFISILLRVIFTRRN